MQNDYHLAQWRSHGSWIRDRQGGRLPGGGGSNTSSVRFSEIGSQGGGGLASHLWFVNLAAARARTQAREQHSLPRQCEG